MQTAFENKDYDFLSTLSTVVRSMSEGELLALQLSDQPLNFTEEIYYKIIFAKTASLIAAACKTSAIVSNGEPAVIEAITEYGRNVGMSFQIKDDIFDYSENSQIIGKPVGNDICEGKVTLPLIYALKIATEQEKKEIAELIRKQDISETDIKQIIEFTTKQGGIEYAMEKGRKFSQEAIKHINFLPDSDAKESLINFANYVIEREK
ncbi:Octaprenyl diphosphate synthase [bioreactor metagenome]|uniref:Octaprenyl diphosphate synthase n=1 Tax=bioreactor metagenome TaxID=1076179 RepID=A0A645HKQ1_9ZZZZ